MHPTTGGCSVYREPLVPQLNAFCPQFGYTVVGELTKGEEVFKLGDCVGTTGSGSELVGLDGDFEGNEVGENDGL